MTTRLSALLRRIGAASVKEAANKIGVSARSVYRYGQQGVPDKRKRQVAHIERREAVKKQRSSRPAETPRPPAPPAAIMVPAPKPRVRTREEKQAALLGVPLADLLEAKRIAASRKRKMEPTDLELARLRREHDATLKGSGKKKKRKTKRQLAEERLQYAVEMGIGPEAAGTRGGALYQELAEDLGESESDIYSTLVGSPPDVGIAA